MPQSTTISLIALMVSSGTTFVTYIRTYKQDIQDDRRELRQLLERMIAIPREQLEITKKYASDRGTIIAFDQICNQENSLLSRQAAEVARRLKTKGNGWRSRLRKPGTSRYVSATEYLSIGLALQRAYNLQGAQEFLQLAASSAVDFNDEIAALRYLGHIYFALGKPEDGRNTFRQASQIFSRYRDYDQFTQFNANIQTEINWAYSEASFSFKSNAGQHLDRAEELIRTAPDGFDADNWKMQIDQSRQQLSRGRPPTQTGAPKPFPDPPIG
jgi:tetratricopeptide (TPR) repeat protein